jgi:hypothetical protein
MGIVGGVKSEYARKEECEIEKKCNRLNSKNCLHSCYLLLIYMVSLLSTISCFGVPEEKKPRDG